MPLTNRIGFANLAGDLAGGVTTAVLSLPLALAFGVASGAGPIAGLYGAVCVGFFAALFGGTSTLISEPTGPMTVVMTAIVTTMVAQHPDNGLAMAFTVVMLAGLFQIALGALGLGRYITLMPYTVISGFMSGIGIILIVLQIAPLLGQPAPPGGVPGTLGAIPDLVAEASGGEAFLGILAVLVIFLVPHRVRPYLPPPLLALLIGTGVSFALFQDLEIRRIGEIPMGLPDFQLPVFSRDQMVEIALDALVLGTLGCIDTVLTAMIADSLTRTEHDTNRELIGQGLGNLASGLCGGLPGAGATMGTVANIQSGARTALSGLVRALLLLVVVLWAAPLTAGIPLAVLAGIALKVGIDILDWSFLRRAHRVSLSGTLIMYGVMLLTVLVDLIVAVGVGVFVANILTIERLSRYQTERLRTVTDADDAVHLSEDERALLDRGGGRILLFYLSGPMIFGVAKAIAREHAAMRHAEVLILDLSDVPLLSVTISLAIENMVRDALAAGSRVFVVAPAGPARDRLGRLDLLAGRVLSGRREALEQAVRLVEPSVPGRGDGSSGR